MSYILHAHWLWLYAALAIGLIVGSFSYRGATGRSDHLVRGVIGTAGIGAIVAIAAALQVRSGYPLAFGAILIAFYAGGCVIGRVLRELADFTPATVSPALPPSAAVTGSYLFRDAFAGMGGNTAYLRMPATRGGVARERWTSSTAILTRAQTPASGGYTFPETPASFHKPAPCQRGGPASGLRPHWSWPRTKDPTTPPAL